MPPSNLFFTGKFCPLSQRQKEAVDGIGVNSNLIDKSCTRESINTCGKSIEDLLSEYPLYSPSSNIQDTWGGISFPWEIDENTENLNLDQTVEQWSDAKFKPIISYEKDSLVIVIENEGYTISLYRANEDILSENPAFDPEKWNKVCSIDTTSPEILPSVDDLLNKYEVFNPNPYIESWDEFSKDWGDILSQDLDESEVWNEARILKDFLYKTGDIVLNYSPCMELVCVWIALQNVPNNSYILEKNKKFLPEVQYSGLVSVQNGELIGENSNFLDELNVGSNIVVVDKNLEQHEFVITGLDPLLPKSKATISPSNIALEGSRPYKGVFWRKIYCVKTGFNECLNPSVSSKNNSIPFTAYERVEIGSMGHYVDVPVKYPRLKKALLNELAEVTQNPKTLSEQEVSELKQPGA